MLEFGADKKKMSRQKLSFAVEILSYDPWGPRDLELRKVSTKTETETETEIETKSSTRERESWVSVILQNGSQGSGRGGGEVLTVVTVVQVSANGQIGNVGDAQMQSAASVVDITTLRQLDPSLVEFRIERQFIRAQKLKFEYSR